MWPAPTPPSQPHRQFRDPAPLFNDTKLRLAARQNGCRRTVFSDAPEMAPIGAAPLIGRGRRDAAIGAIRLTGAPRTCEQSRSAGSGRDRWARPRRRPPRAAFDERRPTSTAGGRLVAPPTAAGRRRHRHRTTRWQSAAAADGPSGRTQRPRRESHALRSVSRPPESSDGRPAPPPAAEVTLTAAGRGDARGPLDG